jgi:hypothetical protein
MVSENDIGTPSTQRRESSGFSWEQESRSAVGRGLKPGFCGFFATARFATSEKWNG